MAQLLIHPDTDRALSRIVASMPHALIISGPAGIGLTKIAEHLASKLGSPKLLITPKRKTEGGRTLVTDYEKGSIVIDDVRQLYTLTRSKSMQSQVYIFDFGDRSMTHQAQNAFLKLLEEPRENVHFILATHRPDTLLATIKSRSQRIDARKITPQQSEALLDSLNVHDTTKRARILFAASGLPETMTRLATDDDAYNQRVGVMQDAKLLISGSTFEKIKVIHKYKDDRAGAVTIIDDVNLQLESVLRRSADASVVKQIKANLDTRDAIVANGNIRLQLTANML